MEKDHLKIGDYITLKNLKLDKYLSAEGILLEDVSADNSLNAFENSVFCIHLQRQYSAARELEDFQALYDIDSNSKDKNSAYKYLLALQQGRDNENKLNESYMKQKLGTPVLFGEIVQLLHVKSGKFLTIIPDRLGRDERENIKIALVAEGNSFSWIQILPRYKIDREGDRVLNETEALLKVAERPNEYIHSAEKEPLPGLLHEVNCSLETTSWRLSIFQSVKDSADSSLLMISQIVFLHDPETRSNITILCGGDDSNDEGSKIPSLDGSVSVVIRPVSGILDTNALWVIESKNTVNGGPIHWKNDLVRFRNLNSGRYLSVEQIGGIGENVNTKYLMTTTSNITTPTNTFSLQELNSSNTYLSNAKALQISQNGVWIDRGDYTDSGECYYCVGNTKRDQAMSLLINRYSEKVTIESSLGQIEDPLDVNVGVAARNYLKQSANRTKVNPNNFSAGTIWPGFDNADLAFFSVVAKRILFFIQGYPIATETLSGTEKPNEVAKINRQNMFCDQGSLDILMKLLQKLIPISKQTDNTISIGNTKANVKSEEEKALIRLGQPVLKQSLSILFYVIKNNSRNQMFVADVMPILLAHVGAEPLAANCVTDMLSTNMELQQSKIGSREISIFTDKLRSSKMNSMYLNLLKSTCSCMGKGVSGNQIIVAEVVFKNYNEIIIQVHSDNSRFIKVDWNDSGNSLYIPKVLEPGAPIKGESLLTKGLPNLALSWTTNSIDFSPLGLFGKLSVNVQELFQIVETGSYDESDQPDRMTASKSNKMAVSEYFCAELFLAAEMCIDRNYSAMKYLESLFTYETLLTMIKMNVNEVLKAAAVSLVLRLYVDRDPQVFSSIPCLTRTWSEITKSDKPKLPFVEFARKNQFSLLQQIISEHIADMQGKRWEKLSLYMLQLLRKLVLFNFYGEVDRIKDIVKPLIKALDRRQVEIQIIDPMSAKSMKTSGIKSTRMKRSQSIKATKSSNGLNASAKIASESADPNTFLENEKDEGDIVPWQKRCYEFLTSLPVMGVIICLVFVAIGVLIYQTISGAVGPAYTYFDYVVTFIFAFEVSLRYYCYVHTFGSFTSFFNSVLNSIDVLVVFIDILILSMPTGGSAGNAKYSKALRAARLFRLIRLFRAARVISKLKDMNQKPFVDWKSPLRHYRSPKHELDTMVESVTVLYDVQKIIDDRNISLLLKGFQLWESDSGSSTNVSGPSKNPLPMCAVDIFQKAIEDSVELTLDCEDFDDIFIDILMFEDSSLVQITLDVLMGHHSPRARLLANIQEVQLLVSQKRELQYKTIDEMIWKLERNTETHELWRDVDNEDSIRISDETSDILNRLIEYCTSKTHQLEFDVSLEPDVQIQNLLRNVGFFEVCLKLISFLLEHHSHMSEDTEKCIAAKKNTHDIIRLGSKMMYWFIYNNKTNQQQCFAHLNYFISILDNNIGAHRVIYAIFFGNEELMRQCPKHLILEFTEKICKYGRLPQYLAISGSITHVHDKNVFENQYETVKSFISPNRLPKLVSFCCPVTDPMYEEKVALMKPLLHKRDVCVDDLPAELAYHLELLNVLSGCTVGRVNITTVEAKVQSVFHFRDIVDTILDTRSLLLVKIRSGLFLYNCFIEVEIAIPGMAQSACIWKLLASFVDVLSEGQELCQRLDKDGWEGSGVPRQKIEFVLVCVMIISGFFNLCYDPAAMYSDDAMVSRDRVQLSMQQINELIAKLFHLVKPICEMNLTVFSSFYKNYFIVSLDALNRAVNKTLMSDAELIHMETVNTSNTEEEEMENMTKEKKTSFKFERFINELLSDESIKGDVSNENSKFIGIIEKLPFLSENVTSDVRYEPFIRKLVAHTRSRIEICGDEKKLDARCTKTSIWIIQIFRKMIENRWGMTIYERDEDGGEEQDKAAGPVMKALNDCGATTLCLDLICIGIDTELMIECVKLCVALLFREGGSHDVQKTINEYLSSTNSEFFFKQLRLTIQDLLAWHKWHDVIILEPDAEPDLPEYVIIVRFMQLMCEGHYQPNQDIMREQPNNTTSINLLDDMVSYLNCLSRIPCRTSTNAASRIASTILEVIQGPCEMNQQYFVLNTELVETLNRIMRSKSIRDCVEEEELELKKTGIDIFQGLLEGQGGSSIVYERVLSVIHLDIIEMLCSPPEEVILEDPHGNKIEPPEPLEVFVVLQTECLVLLQMLCDYQPALRKQLQSIKDADDIVGSEVACVEIMWRGELQRRFFHVPDVVKNLSKASKDSLVENVDRSNIESKLQDFIFRSHELYREIKHQEVLVDWHVSGVFSRTNQDKATWLSFNLACLINGLLLAFYSAESGVPLVPPAVLAVVDSLNIFQIIFSTFTLMLFIVVRVPVKYQSNRAAGYSDFWTVIYTASDPLTMYYFAYLFVSILGVTLSDIFLSLLLLDIIVKNSTTRDVLYAVINPRKQLAMTVILGIFVAYIFSFIIFFNFRDNFIDAGVLDCSTLFKCLKVTLGYGLRSPGGVGDLMTHTLGERYILDLMFYLVVLIVLLNVVFGIIIDTFGSLRQAKLERQFDTTERCFICGIDKQIFDRSSDTHNGFKRHIRNDHNMWNYLYFIFYIWEQDKDDDDGLEQYVRRCIARSDIQFFPMNKAMCLSVASSEEDELKKTLKGDLDGSEKNIVLKLTQVQSDINETLEKIVYSLKSATGQLTAGTNAFGPLMESREGQLVTSSDTIRSAKSGSKPKSSASVISNVSDEENDMGDESFMVNENIQKSIIIEICTIKNLHTTSISDMQNISCKILCETGMIFVPAKSATFNEIEFQRTEVIVSEQATIHDIRKCRIQIVHETSKGKFSILHALDFDYVELMEKNDQYLIKSFIQDGHNDSECSIVLKVKCVDAFSRVDDGSTLY